MDHVSETDPVDGVLLVDQDYLTGKRVRHATTQTQFIFVRNNFQNPADFP